MASADKPLVWLHGQVKTPPLSATARIEAGVLLRRLQRGEKLSMPHSRPLSNLGPRCHELRINDEVGTFRIMYRVDADAIIILDVWMKKTQQTPLSVMGACRRRLREYDRLCEAEE